jgi:hypothetical protein
MLFKNSVRTSKRTPHYTITKINWLTLFKEIIAVYSENNKDHVSKLYGQPTELLKVKADGTYSYHSAFKSFITFIFLIPYQFLE